MTTSSHDSRSAASCCAPARPVTASRSPDDQQSPAATTTAASAAPRPDEQPAGTFRAGTGTHAIEQCGIPAGTVVIGDQSGDGNRPDGETPIHEVELGAFSIDATTVTNDDFAAFVDATGFVTEAEQFGFSAVFHLAVTALNNELPDGLENGPENGPGNDLADDEIVGRAPGSPWWLGVRGAQWRHPEGARSNLDGRADHPVVHVGWNDAVGYCDWAGRRLPTEAEWECASRGGLVGARYPWGDDLLDADGQWRCNVFQGRFPNENTVADGWATTAPVRSYEPNGFGLWQTVGNVWEWCANWFDARAYERSPRSAPTGPDSGQERVIRGGSYLCHDSYCNRYRCSARTANTPDSSTANMGFRTVAR